MIFIILTTFILLLFFLKVYESYIDDKYEANHKIHEGTVPKIAGIPIYFICLMYLFIHDHEKLLIIILTFFPLLVLSVKEDLFHNTTANKRLIFALLSSLLFYYFEGGIQSLNILENYNLLSFQEKIILFILTTISITSIIHAFNIIDGINGLCALSFSVVVACLLMADKNFFYNELLILLAVIFGFLLLNFPRAFIFLGDTGAYFLGFLASTLTILYFNKNLNIQSWYAVLILIYPITETLLSFFRRILKRESFNNPDNLHLHSQIYIYIRKFNFLKKNANPLTLLLMIPIFSYGPSQFLFNISNGYDFSFLSIGFYLALYLSLWFTLLRLNNIK